MFSSSVPATHDRFFDRERELARLDEAVQTLKRGVPKWLCLVGPRKVGKTSILREMERRSVARGPGPGFVVLDVFEAMPVSLEIFRLLARLSVDTLLGADSGRTLSGADTPGEWRAGLMASERFHELPAELQRQISELPELKVDGDSLALLLNLPERLATALDTQLVIALDEFQELATISSGRGAPDVMARMRAAWQRHRRTTYVVSGSARNTLLELATSSRSPFFQHFEVLEIAGLPRPDAVALLARESEDGRAIDASLAERIYEVVGGNPFYLQALGEAVAAESGRATARLRNGLQRSLFSDTGRLSLYFLNEFQRFVGRATTLAATLNALTRGPLTLAEVSRAINAVPAAATGYLQRLGDAVIRGEDGKWSITDPVFRAWLEWRQPGGTVVPMRLVGDEAELAVAERLAHLGFELVYQSRGSRGAFDLIAMRGAGVLAVQVKRSALPLRFTKEVWERMVADGARYAWKWVVAQVETEGEVRLLDPAKVKRARGFVLDEKSVLERPLQWFDARPRRKSSRT
ncbi:MAG: ATP-binding protein [Archangium sp.]|nr:ATP-binding protein [Archangium sp.]